MKKTFYLFSLLLFSVFIFIPFHLKANDILWENMGNSFRIGNIYSSDDGRYVAGIKYGDSTIVAIYDMVLDREVWSHFLSDDEVFSLSNDGKYLALCVGFNQGAEVAIWNWQNDTKIFSDNLPSQHIASSLYFSPQNNYIAIKSFTFQIQYYGLPQYLDIFSIKDNILVYSDTTAPINCLKFSDDDSKIFVSSKYPYYPQKYYINQINVATGDVIQHYTGNNKEIIAFDLYMNTILSVEKIDNKVFDIVTRDLNTGNIQDEKKLKYQNADKFFFSNDHQLLTICQTGRSSHLTTIDLNSFDVKDSQKALGNSLTFAFSGNHKIAYSNLDDLIIKDINSKDIRKIYDLYNGNNHNSQVTCLALTPDNKYIVSSGNDSRIKIWDCADGKYIKQFQDTNAAVFDIKITSDGKYLMTASGDCNNEINIWELNTGNRIRTSKYTGQYVTKPKFSYDGNYLVFISLDSMIYMYDIQADSIVGRVKLLNDPDINFTLTKDNRYYLGGTNEIQMYELTKPYFLRDKYLASFMETLKCLALSDNENYYAYFALNEASVGNFPTSNSKCYMSNSYLDDKGNKITMDYSSMAFSSDNMYLLGGIGRAIKVLDINNHKEKYTYLGNNYAYSTVTNLISSDQNKLLISSNQLGSVMRWKTEDIISGVKDTKSVDSGIEIFPNPAGYELNIRNDNLIDYITFINLLGKSVKLYPKSHTSNLYSYEVSGLAPGLYMLSFISGNDIINKRFIKE